MNPSEVINGVLGEHAGLGCNSHPLEEINEFIVAGDSLNVGEKPPAKKHPVEIFISVFVAREFAPEGFSRFVYLFAVSHFRFHLSSLFVQESGESH